MHRAPLFNETAVSTVLLVAAFGAALGLRVGVVDPAYAARSAAEHTSARVVADARVLDALALEHALAGADALWLTIVQEFGKAIEGLTVDDNAVIGWADAATDLDDKYLTVYHSVAINLSVYSRLVDESDRILAKGRAALPNEWPLPFMVGYNAYFLRGDAAAATKAWREASQLPRAPRFLLSLAARSLYQAGDPRGAEQMLVDMLPALSGPARRDAEVRLKMFRSEPILAEYDRACEIYRAEHGVVPEDAKVLLELGLVSKPPFDLLDKPIEIDENCRARTSLIFVREDEAKKNLGSPVDSPEYLDLVRERK